jgi:phosphate transport system permease protein
MTPDATGLRRWLDGGEPWIWLNAAAVGVSVSAVVGLLVLIATQGLAHFWPAAVLEIRYAGETGAEVILGERTDREWMPRRQYLEANPGLEAGALGEEVERWLIRTGNRREAPPDFRWLYAHKVESIASPVDAVVVERTEWGNVYGHLADVREAGAIVAQGATARAVFAERLARSAGIREEIAVIEREEIDGINDALEEVRLERRRHELAQSGDQGNAKALGDRESQLVRSYEEAESRLRTLRAALARDAARIVLADGQRIEVTLADAVRVWYPNDMTLAEKLGHYAGSVWIFLSEAPREANTEGGIFPAIFGTVMMVVLMSLLVTPFGVMAALYLREYARQGFLVRIIRIAVNNLAGVPSIVYGVFGLGFFVYLLGGAIDQLFYPETLPAPTFGTPGLLWASLTLALLTVPVVIVSTEEGLTRIPRAVREGSLALGATKAETLFKVVLPMASPSILTGVILAIARAAGEVAPLMLVGVVKLAPSLPLDGEPPFLHLERKFMHLGFHIYDVGFQSPNVEAARPIVYATALLLVIIIVALNLTAIMLRSRLEARYKSMES